MMSQRTGALAFVFAVALLGTIFALKPKTELPEFSLRFEGDRLVARPLAPVEGPLQAEAFLVTGTGVHPISKAVVIEKDYAVLEGMQFPAGGEPLTVGMIIGHADSMPSAEAAWDDMATESKPRAGFRVLTLTTTRARSFDRDRSDRPSP